MNKEQALAVVVTAMHHVYMHAKVAARGIAEGWDTGLAFCQDDAARARHAAHCVKRANELTKRGHPALVA